MQKNKSGYVFLNTGYTFAKFFTRLSRFLSMPYYRSLFHMQYSTSISSLFRNSN